MASVFAKSDISIQTMEQEGMGREAHLVFITHEVEESRLEGALSQLSNLSCVENLALLFEFLKHKCVTLAREVNPRSKFQRGSS
ncbi:MAG: hypothetical protein CM15mP49_31490 [Actinomycetota bacterium]|nr:MAG: hypothetical protein CM15mP49_31490 [Actinomycetota bacterium]